MTFKRTNSAKGAKVSAPKKRPEAGKTRTPVSAPATQQKPPAAAQKPAPRKDPAPRPARAARAEPLDPKDAKEYRHVLFALRDQVTGQISTLKTDSVDPNDPADMEEDGTGVFNRQFALDLVRSENESLFQIDEALRRLETGTYGVCEECGKRIRKPRLKALPFVRTCVDCQADLEKKNRGFRVHASI